MNIDLLVNDVQVQVAFSNTAYPRVAIAADGVIPNMLSEADVVNLAEFKNKLSDFVRRELPNHIKCRGAR